MTKKHLLTLPYFLSAYSFTNIKALKILIFLLYITNIFALYILVINNFLTKSLIPYL